jgi:UDP-glucose 4-epimerase|tara:strand:- start:557 stop:1480 length:924 start_codon:yes stop_codon:yes gene_type:complete
MKFFITGGAGFIGRHLIESLLENNHDVTIYEDFSNSSEDNIKNICEQGALVIHGDLSDYSLLEKSLKDFDFVIHLAAKIDILESITNPEITNKVNVQGTINILKACAKNNIQNIIAASSAAIYGNPKIIPVTEDSVPNPVSPYGADKLSMEFYLRAFSNMYNLNTISLRFFNVYGKGQSNAYAGVITKFLKNIERNEPIKILGNGNNTRDYVFIDDLIHGILQAIKNIQGQRGNIFNLASGKSTSVNDLAFLMLKISKKKLEIIHKSPRPGDLLFSEVLISKAKEELQYNPKFNLELGLTKLFEEMK